MQSRHPALPCHPRHRRSDRPGRAGPYVPSRSRLIPA